MVHILVFALLWFRVYVRKGNEPSSGEKGASLLSTKRTI